MEMKRIKVEIGENGTYAVHTLEGFSGTNCVQQTQELEIALGGGMATATNSGKTSSYYDPDEGEPVSITL